MAQNEREGQGEEEQTGMLPSFLLRGAFRDGGGRELIAVAEDVRTLSLSAGLQFLSGSSIKPLSAAEKK